MICHGASTFRRADLFKDTLSNGDDVALVAALIQKATAELSRPSNSEKLRELRQHAFGNSDEPIVVSFCDEGGLKDNCVSVCDLFSGAVSSDLQKSALVGYVRPLKDVLCDMYTIKPGKYTKLPDCTVEWSLSIIPLFVELRYRFRGTDSVWPWLVHVDCFTPQDLVCLQLLAESISLTHLQDDVMSAVRVALDPLCEKEKVRLSYRSDRLDLMRW